MDEDAVHVLFLAHSDGTIGDEELVCFLTTLAEDEAAASKDDDLGPRFDLDVVTDKTCKELFRFTKSEIRRLRRLLLIPEDNFALNRTCWSGEEGLCILLRRLAYPCRLCDLRRVFGRGVPDLSIIFNSLLTMLVARWGNLFGNFAAASWFTPARVASFAERIHAAKAPLTNCWGFIDGTVRPICRPISCQRYFYSGHKRIHAIQFQTIVSPDGMIAHLFGPMEGSRHDNGMLRESQLLAYLETQMPLTATGGEYCIYGDPAYPLRPQLMVPFQGGVLTADQKAWNKKMSACRVSVEWGYAKVIQLFPFVDFKKNVKILLQPVGALYTIAALFTNCHTCLHGCETSNFFGMKPPTLEEYLQ